MTLYDDCRMVTKKLLTGTDRDCDCGVVYDDLQAEVERLTQYDVVCEDDDEEEWKKGE